MDSSSPFSRKIGRQPVFGRGGMNFDGTSGVEMVTSTTTQFQQTTTSVIRSNNLNEVHSIISRVDSAYKLRKKECQRLQWEISDLESQLEDIQRQTLEYTETSAIQNAALSWTRTSFDKLVADFDEVQAAHAAAYQQAQATMNDAINEVIACACIYGREFDVLRKEKDVIEKSAKQTDVTVSRLAEQYNGLFYQLKNVQANIDDAVATIEDMREINMTLDQEYESTGTDVTHFEAVSTKILEEHAKAEHEHAQQKDHLTSLLRQHEELDHLSLDIKHKTDMKVKKLQVRNAEVEQMRIDCVEQTMSIEQETKVSLNSIEEIKASTDAVKADNMRLATDLQVHKAQVLEIKQQVEQEESTTVNLKADISDQQSQLASLKSSIFNIQQANKRSFEATCLKMKELKGLHEVISRAQNECQKAELLKQERQSLLEAALRREIGEEETEKEELKQIQVQLANQRLAANEAKERNKMSKQELYSACVERAHKEAKKSQLEDLVNEMERALHTVRQKQNECNELQTATDIATREREAQTMRCENLDSEITKLNAEAQDLQKSATVIQNSSFAEQELDEIEAEVQVEYEKFCHLCDMKQQREVDEIESYREQIRRSNSSSSKATQLKAEIDELEALIAEAIAKREKGESLSPKRLVGKENVTNIAAIHGRKLSAGDATAEKSLSSLWDFKPAATRTEKAGSSGLFSFKRRKTTPSSRMSDMDASMEDLFADDI